MGQKVNANSLRLGVIKGWKSRYYASTKEEWKKFIKQDDQIRKFFEKKQRELGIEAIEIERSNSESAKIIIKTSKPGVVLGQDGANVKELTLELQKALRERKTKFEIEVSEIKFAELSAKLAAETIAEAIENRASFRIAQKRVIREVLRSGAKGIKTQVSGRLNGVEMARTEGYSHGVVPLQTIRNDVDYATAEAHTTYGVLGIKVWISKGEVLDGKNAVEREARSNKGRAPRRDNRRPARRDNAPKKGEAK